MFFLALLISSPQKNQLSRLRHHSIARFSFVSSCNTMAVFSCRWDCGSSYDRVHSSRLCVCRR